MNASIKARLKRAGQRRAKADTDRSAASQALAEVVCEARAAGMGPTEIASAAGISRQAVHNMLRKGKP